MIDFSLERFDRVREVTNKWWAGKGERPVNDPQLIFSKIDKYITKEQKKLAYIDVLLISLREIKNWSIEQKYIEKKEYFITTWINILTKVITYMSYLFINY